jgi:ribosomal protein RSM22 (predicted rRNA methylase)
MGVATSRLPAALQEKIDAAAKTIPQRKLAEAAARLSAAYRAGESVALTDDALRAAYLVTRLPATIAALEAVFEQVPGEIRTLLDLGAGPGASVWAAPWELDQVTLVERDAAWTDVTRGQWIRRDMRQLDPLPEHDLVLCSYSLGELAAEDALGVLERAWRAAARALVMVEPGTVAGFERMRLWRTWLIGHDARIAAPCPHERECPMRDGDWCHFSRRLERTHLHRILKGGDLGYEDEKFTYLVAVKEPARPAAARIVRHPEYEKNLVQLTLCGAAGIEQLAVRKRDEAYKRARKARWGEAWNASSTE